MTEDPSKILRLALIASRGNITTLAEHLGVSKQAAHKRVRVAGLEAVAAKLRGENNVKGTRSAIGASDRRKELRRLRAAVRDAEGNITAAADALGMHRDSLRRRIERLSSKTN